MSLRQQLLQDKIDSIASNLDLSEDVAFLYLTHSLVTGKSIYTFDPLDIVDGGQDKQLDVISIEEDDSGASIYIIQGKKTDSFSSNALIQLRNGLRWVFGANRKELEGLLNSALRDKIQEVRSVNADKGPSNVRVIVRYVTLGPSKDISREFKQELQAIRDEYDNETFESFNIEALGCDELTMLSKSQDRKAKSVDADLKVKYDANNPSLIKYHAEGLKGLVCSIPATEIARLVNDNPDGSIFDLNIRRFLGDRGSVNKDIQQTATSVEDSYEFWFLNNGITIVCDSFDMVADPDNPKLKLKNLQIVNGCQTATTIGEARKQGKLRGEVKVLTRVYETKNPQLISRIVLTTNNQNQISSRDLRANEPTQLDMEQGFEMRGYFYERKPRQYDSKKIDIGKLFTNELVGQAFLAIVLKTPSDARARKYKVWGELHAKVFCGTVIETYLIASLISRKADQWLRNSQYITDSDESNRTIAKRGKFFVARIATYLWRGNDSWTDEALLKDQLSALESTSLDLDTFFDEAFHILKELVNVIDPSGLNIDRTLKSGVLDREIDKRLYGAKRATRTRKTAK